MVNYYGDISGDGQGIVLYDSYMIDNPSDFAYGCGAARFGLSDGNGYGDGFGNGTSEGFGAGSYWGYRHFESRRDR